ncbi:DUF1579 domain-containing protein [Phenylobacterium deserti]|nr:DUF1579 domain-containing protein [Phenylobacterium deserti]
MGDFGFQTGEWRVHHRKLAERLTGCSDWVEFNGTCRASELTAGEANVEDQLLDDPAGAYRAAAFRRCDPQTGEWAIWWHDGRSTLLDPPVKGRFEGGVGRFYAHDTLRGQPILVRFVWSDIGPERARWEQAFSPDGGATWEVNWIMSFERTA